MRRFRFLVPVALILLAGSAAAADPRADAIRAFEQRQDRDALVQLEDGEKALKAYLSAGPREDNDPPRAAAHWRLGMVFERAKRIDEARAEYRLALQENPQMEEARKALDALD